MQNIGYAALSSTWKPMNLATLETCLSNRLNLSVRLALTNKPLDEMYLDAAGKQRLSCFATTKRKTQWLRGLNAQRKLRRRLDFCCPVLSIESPHSEFSITHDNGMALAAGVIERRGIGVDFESWRQVDLAMTRWYLSTQERIQLALMPDIDNATLLRLWTVKEALFKACPNNKGLMLTDLLLLDTALTTGIARTRELEPVRFRYTSIHLQEGVVSIAIRD